MIIDGVTIPDIPEELLAYPYSVIFRVDYNIDEPETRYLFVAANAPFGHIRTELLGEMSAVWKVGVVGSMGTGTSLICIEPYNKWDAFLDYDGSDKIVFPVSDGIPQTNDEEYTLIWANSVVYEVATLDPETGAYTIGGIYFPKGKPDRVSIAYTLFDDITKEVQRLSGTKEQMNAIQVLAKLKQIQAGTGSGASVVDVTLTEV